MAEHAKLSPSGCHRWANCTASPAFKDYCIALGIVEKDDEKSSFYAEEGTAAHELLEWSLIASTEEGEEPIQVKRFRGRKTENGFTVDREMERYIQKVLDNVYGKAYELKGELKAKSFDIFPEQRYDLSKILDTPETFGTADIVTIVSNDDRAVLSVEDLKYGKGVKVKAKNNKQLLLYAAGAYQYYSMIYDIEEVHLVIHMPRLDSRTEWKLSKDEFLKLVEEIKVKAQEAHSYLADAAKGIKPPAEAFKPDGDTCRWCDVKTACRAATNKMIKDVSLDFEDLTANEAKADNIKDVNEPIDLKELGKLMDATEFVEMMAKAIRARVEAELLKGNDVPGYGLFFGRKPPRKWKDEAEVLEFVKEGKIEDIALEKKLLSPTKLEKSIKKTAPTVWKALEQMIVQKEPGPTVKKKDSNAKPYSKVNINDFEEV